LASITLTFENFCQGSEAARMLLDPITIAATLSDTTKAILRERYREDFVNFGYDNSDVAYLH
jgi:hypothetical protein